MKSSGARDIHPSFAPIVAAFARGRTVSRGKAWGADNAVLTVNGKIFAMWVKGKFVAKLPRERVDELVRTGGEYFDRGQGKPLKEWVALRGGQARWIELAKEAQRFVKGAGNKGRG